MMLVLCLLCACSDFAPGTYNFSAYPYLYSRHGMPLEPDEKLVSVLAVGDFVPGESLVNTSLALVENAPWLKSTDLTLLNLEGTLDLPGISTPGEPLDPAYAPYRHLIPPEVIADLRSAGVDLLNLANNHSFESGAIGLAGSIAAIEDAGLTVLGVQKNESISTQPITKTIHGIRLAFLAFTVLPPPGLTTSDIPRPSVWDADLSPGIVQAVRKNVDIVIVSMHWGFEYQTQVDPLQKQIAQSLAQAGADLVIGHHPHVIQGSQLFDGPRISFTAYSLGNFLFEQSVPETRDGLALLAVFDRNGLRAIQAIPLTPVSTLKLQTLEQATKILTAIEPSLPRKAFTCDAEACLPSDSPAPSGMGIFTSAAADLSGDGKPEQVSLREGVVRVWHGAQLAWESPPDWKVLDLATGDPNDDGRDEILLALRKPDGEGKLQSQPFIIGWRNGQYRTLWGGSPVSEPIHEVELGEVDGDSPQELVVLDEVSGTEGLTISVWDWHGWGFSLKWRSPAGIYKDLQLVQYNASPFKIISSGYIP